MIFAIVAAAGAQTELIRTNPEGTNSERRDEPPSASPEAPAMGSVPAQDEPVAQAQDLPPTPGAGSEALPCAQQTGG